MDFRTTDLCDHPMDLDPSMKLRQVYYVLALILWRLANAMALLLVFSGTLDLL